MTQFSDKRFLIVESLKNSRDILKQFAMHLNVDEVDDTSYANDALLRCKEVKYDVILLGYDLGDHQKNGQQLLEELKTYKFINREAIVIIVTAETTQAMVLAALEHKPDDYLTKPFTFNELNKRLNRCNTKKRSMSPIYRALDAEMPRQVISLCALALEQKTPYKIECLGIKSLQHFKLEEFELAEEIYLANKDKPNCQWANIGLGKIALKQQKYRHAEGLFQDLINKYPMYLSSYDWLTQTYIDQNDFESAERTLSKAINLSPLSVVRMNKYAKLCEYAGISDKAALAYERSYLLSKNTVHQKPENVIDYAKSANNCIEQLTDLESKRLKNRVSKAIIDTKKYCKQPSFAAQVQLLSVSIMNKTGEKIEASRLLKLTELLIKKLDPETDPKELIKIAELLIDMNRRDSANEVINTVVTQHPEVIELMTEVDKLLASAQTQTEESAAQNALNDAIQLYKQKMYVETIDKLTQVLNTYPSHLGIRLNLIQALLTQFEESGKNPSYLNTANVHLTKLNYIKSGHHAYGRYRNLQNKFMDATNSIPKSLTKKPVIK